MNSRRCLAASLLALAPLACGAAELLDVYVAQTVRGVERGYARAMSQLAVGTLEQPSALTLTDPFQAGGLFPPRPRQDIGWQLQGLDADRSMLCVTVSVAKADDWNQALAGLAKAGMSPGSAQTCTQTSQFTAAPDAFPATIAGVKVLHRGDVPVRTVLPTGAFDPVFAGVDGEAVTRPGLALSSMELNYTEIQVTNPALIVGYTAGPPSVPIYRTLTLSNVAVREGFEVEHDCENVGPDATCTIGIRYEGAHGDYRTGVLRLEFDTGARAVIGLLGRTQ